MHNVETLAYSRKTPWHGLGHNAGDTLMTPHEALSLAGLNWTVSARDLYLPGDEGALIETPFRAIVRDSDGAIYGSVRERYETFQNSEVADFIETVCDVYGAPIVEVAASLAGGSRIFFICKISEIDAEFKFLTEQERHDWYLFVRNTHDGSGALTAEPTGVRVVCQNTENMAIQARNKEKGFVSIRHTTNMQDRVADATASLGVVTSYAKMLDEAAAIMADAKAEGELVEKLINSMVPVPAERGKDKALAAQDDLRANIFGSPTVDNNLRGTKWGVFQATTEWLEHDRDGRNWGKTPVAERRMLANFGGPVGDKRQKAWNLLNA